MTGVMTDNLRAEYIGLFQDCQVLADHADDVKAFCSDLMDGMARYQLVENATNVPWYVVGLIHGMECGFDFTTHLHNGDPLTARTVNEPRGRPPVGDPPFPFLVSAIDALQYDRFTGWEDWSVAGICFKLEGYNGWGYRSHQINSPYLWSFSNQYERGKYISDGDWDPDAVSEQVGAIVALKQLVLDELVALPAEPGS